MIYKPVNKVESATTKYILLILESLIALDKIKVDRMMSVMMIKEMKFERKGSASRLILFLLMI